MRTNNLFSNLMGGGKSAVPNVGDGATILMYTDRRVGTVVKVEDGGKTVYVQEDDVTADQTKELGMGHQEWVITPNPNNRIEVFTLRKNGKYIAKGAGFKNGTQVVFGYKEYYYDWSF